MSGIARFLGLERQSPKDDDLDEWARHHDDPRSQHGEALVNHAKSNPDLTLEELSALWREANSLVGKRAPADYGEFLAYGYLEGRKDALIQTLEKSA